MPTPLGVVRDVAVGPDAIYLLDQQNTCIWRIDLAGAVTSFGQRGEGPGDIAQPSKLARGADGRLWVVDSFSRRVSCFDANGGDCPSLDVSSLRSGYVMTLWFRADAGPNGDLYFGTLANRRRAARGASLEEMGTVAQVRRLRLSSDKPDLLFSTDADDASKGATTVPTYLGNFVGDGWDIGNDGTLVYADPQGEYRVFVGYPPDSRVLALPEWPRDADRLARQKRDLGATRIPRLTTVQWIDDTLFMVRPTAEIDPERTENLGTFEVFDRSASSYGRHTVMVTFDKERDDVFIRGDVVVVIQEGKGIARAAYHIADPRVADGEPREIRIRAYKLFESVIRTAK